MTTRTAASQTYPPYGMRVADAARYVGYSESAFQERVKVGVFPKPVKDRGVSVWLRDELESALRDIRDREAEESQEEVDAWAARIGS